MARCFRPDDQPLNYPGGVCKELWDAKLHVPVGSYAWHNGVKLTLPTNRVGMGSLGIPACLHCSRQISCSDPLFRDVMDIHGFPPGYEFTPV